MYTPDYPSYNRKINNSNIWDNVKHRKYAELYACTPVLLQYWYRQCVKYESLHITNIQTHIQHCDYASESTKKSRLTQWEFCLRVIGSAQAGSQQWTPYFYWFFSMECYGGIWVHSTPYCSMRKTCNTNTAVAMTDLIWKLECITRWRIMISSKL